MRGRSKKLSDLDLVYRMALVALVQLLFIAYAEDRDLLPYRHNDAYRRRSLKQKLRSSPTPTPRSFPSLRGTSVGAK